MTTQFDAIVIGTGQAWPVLAGRLSREGLKTAIVERKLIGGTCVNVGCIPIKTVVGSAKVAYTARQAQSYRAQSISMQRSRNWSGRFYKKCGLWVEA